MIQHEQALKRILPDNKSIKDFKALFTTAYNNNIQFDWIHDPTETLPAYFSTAMGWYGCKDNPDLTFNQAAPIIEIALKAIHERSHMTQYLALKNITFSHIKDYNIMTQIGYSLLAEAHAYSDQCEVALKQYMGNLTGDKQTSKLADLMIDAIYQKKSNYDYDDDRYLFNAYLNAFRDKKLYTPGNKKEAIKTMVKFNENASYIEYKDALINGRKNAFRCFFNIDDDGSQRYTTDVHDILDEYIYLTLDGIEEYYNEFKIAPSKVKMPLNIGVSTFLTDNTPFVSQTFIEETLNVKSLPDVAEKYLCLARREKKFRETIVDLTSRETLREWHLRKHIEYKH